MTAIDLTGRVFGRLTVTTAAGRSSSGELMWSCSCFCGETTTVRSRSLRRGLTRSCGCRKRDAAREAGKASATHGQSKTATYASWRAMLNRCTNAASSDYANYGGRGIGVCGRWMTSFANFVADMGHRATGTSLDRVDNERWYEPENCRWATPTEQNRNQRSSKLNSDSVARLRALRAAGMTMRDIAAELGVSRTLVVDVIAGRRWQGLTRVEADEQVRA